MADAWTICAVCQRVVWTSDVDGEGRCCHCARPPQGADGARPPADQASAPRLSDAHPAGGTELA